MQLNLVIITLRLKLLLLFCVAIDKAVTFKVRDGKDYLIRKTIALCGAYKKEVVGMPPSKAHQLTVCRSLSMLPAMTLALIKSVSTFLEKHENTIILTTSAGGVQ